MISAGMISAEGVDVFISVTDEMRSPVNFFSIATGYPSTGHWIFDSCKILFIHLFIYIY